MNRDYACVSCAHQNSRFDIASNLSRHPGTRDTGATCTSCRPTVQLLLRTFPDLALFLRPIASLVWGVNRRTQISTCAFWLRGRGSVCAARWTHFRGARTLLNATHGMECASLKYGIATRIARADTHLGRGWRHLTPRTPRCRHADKQALCRRECWCRSLPVQITHPCGISVRSSDVRAVALRDSVRGVGLPTNSDKHSAGLRSSSREQPSVRFSCLAAIADSVLQQQRRQRPRRQQPRRHRQRRRQQRR